MNNLASPPSAQPPVQLPDLILSLEQATVMAKQLPVTTDQNHLLQIYSSLNQAHHHLSSFISHTHQFPLPPPTSAAENSLSSAATRAAGMAGADEYGGEPMQVIGDDDYEAGADAEENSEATVDMVEEKMRVCFIKNKRAKRPLSPSSAAEERRLFDDGDTRGIMGFDPHGTRSRALDLIYQFHC